MEEVVVMAVGGGVGSGTGGARLVFPLRLHLLQLQGPDSK